MKKLLFLLCLIGYAPLFSQTLNRDSLVGAWTCKDVFFNTQQKMSAMDERGLDLTKKGFTTAKFVFGANGVFTLQLPKGAPPEIVEMMSFLNKKPWSFDPANNTILIGTPKENLMELIVHQENAVVTFLMDETPLSLWMVKAP